MRAVVQRVSKASVHVGDELVSAIGPGLVTLLGVHRDDQISDVDWLIRKIVALRLFEDRDGKMNISLLENGGAHLIVSQFTLWGDARKGNRPSFTAAARPESARSLYERAIEISASLGVPTCSGRFQATMQVELINDGPVTLILDSPSRAE